jgi:tripartite-type tricarboxylate transporter receptor subunit TctC
MRIGFVVSVLVVFLGISIQGPASAQDYPNKPVKIIVPNPPGGGFDTVGRVVANQLTQQMGQVIVENRTGAGTLVGTEAAAKAPADGYTLLVGSFSNIAANPGLYKNLPYDPLADFIPAGMVVSYSYVLTSRKDLPQNNLKEILDFARANPGKLTYASAGVGTGQHVAAAVLAQLSGVNMMHVPYRGAQAAYQDLLSGRVDFLFDNAGTAKPFVDDGRVKGFVVSSSQRFAGLPNLPTVTETGLAQMSLEAWFGIFARTGTPAPVMEKLRAEMAKVMQSPDVIGRFEKGGGRILRMSGHEADAFVRSQVTTWTKLIRDAGIQAE